MATYVLIPGAGSDPWYWHLVGPRLQQRGHDVVAVDLPSRDENAGLADYVDATVNAIGDRAANDDLVVVAQSLAAFIAPVVCTRVPARLLVLVAAMTPRPGESAGEWWANAGHVFPEPFDPVEVFLHDVPPDVAAASASHVHEQASGIFRDPWPLAAWPDVPTRFILCTKDRFFPADFQRRVVKERLGIEPDEMTSGHLPALAHPADLVELLERCRTAL